MVEPKEFESSTLSLQKTCATNCATTPFKISVLCGYPRSHRELEVDNCLSFYDTIFTISTNSVGAISGTRTHNLRLIKTLRYHCATMALAGATGFEPA